MQTLESLGVPASAFLIPHNMPEAPNNGQQQGWGHPQQGFNPQMDQGVVGMSPQQPNHIFVMNNVNVKPEQPVPRREEVLSSPPQPANPSVITATYNPTYNRCLPKILSDLDCEMKIKQVLRCIENILLENGDVDLQQQAYKLPDRSSSPQFAKTKKPKFKEDEEMQSPGPASINLPLATNSPATLINKGGVNKNPIKINVKVEPDGDKNSGMRTPGYEQAVPTTSPRAHQMFDAFPYKQQQQSQQQQQQPHTPQQQYPPSPMTHTQRPFGYDNYSNGHGQPMVSPHMHLSMSSPHLATNTNSPHLQQHLHTSSPHVHTGQHSPHVHSPLHAGHTNSPHLVHSPHPHSPLGQSNSNQQTHSPHMANGTPSPQHGVPVQYHMHGHPHQQEESQQRAPEVVPADYHFQQVFAEGVQEAGGFKPQDGAQTQKKDVAMPTMQDFVLDPALFAQYLAANQQQLQQLQQQLHQQQIQHSQLQQQRLQQQPQQPQQHQPPQQHQQSQQQQQQQSQQHQQAHQQQQQQAHQQQQQAHQQHQQQQAHQQQQQQSQQSQQQQQGQHPAQLMAMAQQLFDPAHHGQGQQGQQQQQQQQQQGQGQSHHPISLSGHLPMSLSGHFFQQMGVEGVEDDKWILSLLNTDSSIAHDLSLSGHIPPL